SGSQRSFIMLRSQTESTSHARTTNVHFGDAKSGDEPQKRGRRRQLPQGFQMAGNVMPDRQVESLKIGAQLSAGMPLGQKSRQFHRVRSDKLRIRIVEQIEIVV